MLPCLEAAQLPADAVEVGRIIDAWGIKGWLKVQPYSASPEALFSSKRWYLKASERGIPAFEGTGLLRISQAKEHSDGVVACVHDLSDRTQAESLKGCSIWISRGSFPTLATDEYYWVDLIGLNVLNRQGLQMGVVKELISTGPQSVLVLQSVEDGKEVERMIPFVSAFVDQVDLAAQQILVDWQLDY